MVQRHSNAVSTPPQNKTKKKSQSNSVVMNGETLISTSFVSSAAQYLRTVLQFMSSAGSRPYAAKSKGVQEVFVPDFNVGIQPKQW